MKQEPVACVYQNFGIGRVAWLTEVPPDGTKLYTHPVKELTDEEIHDLIINKTTDADMIKQAIRKAHSNCNGFCGEYECKENQTECKRKVQDK